MAGGGVARQNPRAGTGVEGQRTATEVFESRTVTINRGGAIPIGYCEFSDPFATAASYHCYRID